MKKLLLILAIASAMPAFSMQVPATGFENLPREIKQIILDFLVSKEPVEKVAKNIVNYFSTDKTKRAVWDNQAFVNALIDKLAKYDASKNGRLNYNKVARLLPKVPTVLEAIKNHDDLISALSSEEVEKAKNLIENKKTSIDGFLLNTWDDRAYRRDASSLSTLIKAGVNPNYEITTVSPFEQKVKLSLLALVLALYAESTSEYSVVGKKAGYAELKEIVKELIKAGANVNAENPHMPWAYGKTLLDLAKKTNDAEIVKLLVDAGAK